MSSGASPGRRARRRIATASGGLAVAAAVVLAILAAVSALAAARDGRGDVPRSPKTLAAVLRAAARQDRARAASPTARAARRRAPRPVWVDIPRIGVHAPVIPLGLDRNRALEVPARFDETGWWKGGARPGERGPAIIVGHVDSRSGPAVFFRLGQLRRGDRVSVVRRDRSRVRFAVRRTEHYSKSRFPTRRVYGATRRSTLRLITCSGDFDRSTGHYVDNTVVYLDAA